MSFQRPSGFRPETVLINMISPGVDSGVRADTPYIPPPPPFPPPPFPPPQFFHSVLTHENPGVTQHIDPNAYPGYSYTPVSGPVSAKGPWKAQVRDSRTYGIVGHAIIFPEDVSKTCTFNFGGEIGELSFSIPNQSQNTWDLLTGRYILQLDNHGTSSFALVSAAPPAIDMEGLRKNIGDQVFDQLSKTLFETFVDKISFDLTTDLVDTELSITLKVIRKVPAQSTTEIDIRGWGVDSSDDAEDRDERSRDEPGKDDSSNYNENVIAWCTDFVDLKEIL